MAKAKRTLDLPEASDAVEQIIRRAQVRYTTVGEMVYSVIRQAIVSGAFGPGEHLSQDALAESMDVSRMPVRSALMQLESEGLIDFHSHRGGTVRSLTGEQVREIYEIRILLESYALRRAIKEMDPERLRHLRKLAAELDQEDDGERFIELRVAFYRALYDADQYSLVTDLIERLRGEVNRYWLRRRVVDRHEPGHRQLLNYVRKRDSDGAVRWLRNHLRKVADELVSLIQQGATK